MILIKEKLIFQISILLRKLESNWRYKTIEALEKHDFGDPKDATTKMIRRCLELCRIPLVNFTVEDLRLMIGQNFSLRYLVPLATEHLHKDIFAEGDLYPGDLLTNVLKVDQAFWKKNKTMWREIENLIKDKRGELGEQGISTILFDAAAFEF